MAVQKMRVYMWCDDRNDCQDVIRNSSSCFLSARWPLGERCDV